MQHPIKRAVFLLVALLLTLYWLPIKATGFTAAPQHLYLRAWQMVSDNYYDPSFNHQDWESWHHKYDGKLQTDAQAYEAIRSMLSSLKDPYTRFLDPKTYQEEDDAINAFVCGVGMSLRPYTETHALIVNDVIEGGPAAKADIEYGDEIVAIDGTSTQGINGDTAADKIRGAAGTFVTLKIKRADTLRVCKITRARVCIPSVSSKILEGNIGYIKLSTFMSDDASQEFRLALQRMSSANGLVIDLRNNPGGLLANAIEIADMLMESGKIVTTESRRGKSTDACTGGVMTNQPVVVLCDHDSASASEILAGALKDNGRATLIGTKTYGKGLVQEINRLPDGSGLHITVARYYTPNGSDINKIGIAPDVLVDDRNSQLSRAVELMKQQLAARSGSPSNMVSAPIRRYGLGPHLVSPRS